MPFINGKVKVEELDHGGWKLLEELEYKGARDTFKGQCCIWSVRGMLKRRH